MFIRAALAALVLSMIPLLSGCGGGLGSLLGIAPTITGITPNPVAPGAAITIAGANLNGTSTTVFYAFANGGSVGSVSASSGGTTSVMASVPSGLTAGSYSVYVETVDSSGDVSAASNSVTISVS